MTQVKLTPEEATAVLNSAARNGKEITPTPTEPGTFSFSVEGVEAVFTVELEDAAE